MEITQKSYYTTFHFAILKEFVCIFEKQSKRLVEKFREIANTGEAVDVQVPVSLATLDVICETAMGADINAQYASNFEYVEAVNSVKHELVPTNEAALVMVSIDVPLHIFWKKVL